MTTGADWMVGNVGVKAKSEEKKLQRAPSPLELDRVEKFLEDAAGDGKKLVVGLKSAVTALEGLRSCGLTGEALVVLVHAKCRRPGSGGKPPTPDTVQAVLEGLFRLGEHVR